MKDNDHIRNELIKMIMNHHPRLAINSVGGYENFVRIMNIKEPIDYLNLFNDLPYIKKKLNLHFRYDDHSPVKFIYRTIPQSLLIVFQDFNFTFLPLPFIHSWFESNYNLPLNNCEYMSDLTHLIL